MREYYMIVVGLHKTAVIFTGLGFYGIVEMQRYLQSVTECDYSIEVLFNSNCDFHDRDQGAVKIIVQGQP